MNRKKEQLQFIIDQQYNLENMKGAFKALIIGEGGKGKTL
jgi:hypothetical protein